MISDDYDTYKGKIEKEGISSAIFMMKGKRDYMEDAFCCDYNDEYGLLTALVFDGHGSSAVSEYLARNSKKHLVPIFIKSGRDLRLTVDTFCKVMDDRVRKAVPQSTQCGSTLSGFIFDTLTRDICIFNVGDSRTTLFKNKEHMYETRDHDLSSRSEVLRILSEKAFLVNNRVDGILNLTRSFGDTSIPSISKKCDHAIFNLERDGDTRYDVVIVSDGVTATTQHVSMIDWEDAAKNSYMIGTKAYSDGSDDNITVLTVYIQ